MKPSIAIALLVIAGTTLCGCAMLTAWKAIPPPGGCDQCHTVAVSMNWQVAYKPVTLNDERNILAFQTSGYNVTATTTQPESSLDLRKVQESKCFECHKAPSAAHAGRSGRYHH